MQNNAAEGVACYIPCFNGRNTIGDCLRTLAEGLVVPEYILVVDDGSTDGSGDIARSLDFQVIEHPTNQGLAATRNTALQYLAGYEWIASIDADVTVNRAWLQNLIRTVKPGIMGVGGRLIESRLNTPYDIWRARYLKQEWPDEIPGYLHGNNTLWRTKALMSVGRYNEDFKTNFEDVDISLRVLKKYGQVLRYNKDAYAFHQRTDDLYSLMRTSWNWAKPLHILEGRFNTIAGLQAELAIHLPRYVRSRWLTDEGYPELRYIDHMLLFMHGLQDVEFFGQRTVISAPLQALGGLILSHAPEGLWDEIQPMFQRDWCAYVRWATIWKGTNPRQLIEKHLDLDFIVRTTWAVFYEAVNDEWKRLKYDLEATGYTVRPKLANTNS